MPEPETIRMPACTRCDAPVPPDDVVSLAPTVRGLAVPVPYTLCASCWFDFTTAFINPDDGEPGDPTVVVCPRIGGWRDLPPGTLTGDCSQCGHAVWVPPPPDDLPAGLTRRPVCAECHHGGEAV